MRHIPDTRGIRSGKKNQGGLDRAILERKADADVCEMLGGCTDVWMVEDIWRVLGGREVGFMEGLWVFALSRQRK